MAAVAQETAERVKPGYSELVPALLEIQAKHNYLPEDALRAVAERLDVALSQVYSVATFYKAFSLTPRGKHIVSVCLGTACHVRGAPAVLGEAERQLGIKQGETTDDMTFSLERVNCVGACALGPVVLVDGKYYEHMTPQKLRKLLNAVRKKDSGQIEGTESSTGPG